MGIDELLLVPEPEQPQGGGEEASGVTLDLHGVGTEPGPTVFSGILGAVLGGSLGTAGPATLLAQGVQAKVDLPDGAAQSVVEFVLGKLLAGGGGEAAVAEQGFDLGDLVKRLASERDLGDFLEESGMVEQLAKSTGLDSKTAADGIEAVLGILASLLGFEQPAKKRTTSKRRKSSTKSSASKSSSKKRSTKSTGSKTRRKKRSTKWFPGRV